MTRAQVERRTGMPCACPAMTTLSETVLRRGITGGWSVREQTRPPCLCGVISGGCFWMTVADSLLWG